MSASASTVCVQTVQSNSIQTEIISKPDVFRVKLRRRRLKKNLQWGDDIPDNEFMNKKSSKKCCVFHKPKRFDESDTDSEDDGKKPKREFKKHVHPPGWDGADDCEFCKLQAERAKLGITSSTNEHCHSCGGDHACSGSDFDGSDDEYTSESDDGKDSSAAHSPAKSGGVSFAMDQ